MSWLFQTGIGVCIGLAIGMWVAGSQAWVPITVTSFALAIFVLLNRRAHQRRVKATISNRLTEMTTQLTGEFNLDHLDRLEQQPSKPNSATSTTR